MSIAINSNFERDQLTATFTGQTTFSYSFPVFSDTYLTVYKYAAADTPHDLTQKLTLGVDYSVTGVGEAAGGTIVLTVGATIGDIITIVGTQPIERESEFQDLNPFTVALNQQLNEQTVMQQQTYTYWSNITPHYNFDELVSPRSTMSASGVRPDKLILPMLPDGHVWVGRGEINDDPDDITTALFSSGGVQPEHPGMRESIATWTGTDFILTDNDINISGAFFTPSVGAPETITGFSNLWGAMHWPAHGTAGRPPSPTDGDTYYDDDTNQFFGYLNGIWTPFSTGGDNPVVRKVIHQVAHGLVVGNWVRLSGDTTYVKAIATSAQQAEIEGVVVLVNDADDFTLQTVGYVDVGTFTGLTAAGVYFLSDTVLGQMTLTEPTINGEVSLPLFIAESATTGWIRQSRGIIIGGPGPVPPIGPGTVVKKIHQVAHGFVVGDWLYISGNDVYSKGLATTLATSQVVGVVVDVLDVDDFVLQEIGSIAGVVTQDVATNPIVSGTIYYLSDVTAGKIVNTAPTNANHFTKPLYVQDELATNDGWILAQRPLPVTSNSGNVFLGDLNDGDNYSSTTILNGYKAYDLILITSDAGGGVAGISATGGGLSSIGFQVYSNGAWVNVSYSHYTLGVNSTANRTTTGVIWSSVVNDASETAMILFPAITANPILAVFRATLVVTEDIATLNYLSTCIDNTPVPPVGYTSNGFAGQNTLGGFGATGLRIFFGGGATITPGLASYIAVFGIPNA